MNFAEASGYLKDAGMEKAWEAVWIGFDTVPVHTSGNIAQQQPAHPVPNLGVQTLPVVTALTAYIFFLACVLPHPAFPISFDYKSVNELPSLHTAPPNSNCFSCKNPF